MSDAQQVAEELAKAILKIDDIPGKLGHGGMRDLVTEAVASRIEGELRRFAAAERERIAIVLEDEDSYIWSDDSHRYREDDLSSEWFAEWLRGEHEQ